MSILDLIFGHYGLLKRAILFDPPGTTLVVIIGIIMIITTSRAWLRRKVKASDEKATIQNMYALAAVAFLVGIAQACLTILVYHRMWFEDRGNLHAEIFIGILVNYVTTSILEGSVVCIMGIFCSMILVLERSRY